MVSAGQEMTEQLFLTLLGFSMIPFLLLLALIIVPGTFGISFGIRRFYIGLLLKVFKVGRENIQSTTKEEHVECVHDDDDDEEDAEVEHSSAGNGVASSIQNLDSLQLIKKDSPRHLADGIKAESTESLIKDTKTGSNKEHHHHHEFHLSDAFYFTKKGVEAIIDDEVTKRFSAEELVSWNLLTRTSMRYQYLGTQSEIVQKQKMSTNMPCMDKLIYCQSYRPNAKFNLFCFPWLGGGSLFYAKWFQIFPESIEVNAIRLQGRESRYHEDMYIDIEVAKYDIANTLLPKLKEKPFIFFGHSLGALVSYAVATHLKQEHQMEPQHLIVSGTSCPQVSHHQGRTLTDDEFIDHLTKLGGTPPQVLANRDLMKISMDACRKDSHLLDNYEKYVPLEAVLSCPISFFDGETDIEHDYEGWGKLTTSSFSSQKLPGGHFYLHEEINSRKIAAHIIQANLK